MADDREWWKRNMTGDFIEALRQIEKEKDIPFATLLKTLEIALGKAYKKHYGIAGDVTVHIDTTKNSFKFSAEKLVVVETVGNEHSEMSLATARKYNPNAELGNMIAIEVTPENFGRIAAQTARQV